MTQIALYASAYAGVSKFNKMVTEFCDGGE